MPMAFLFLKDLLQAPTCLITPYKMRFISESIYLLSRDMLCQGVTVWTKNHHDFRVLCLLNAIEFPHDHRWISEGHGSSRSRKQMTAVNKHTTSPPSHASHQYAPRSTNCPKAVRVKDAPLGHPPLALAAFSISNVALVGSRSYRTLSMLQHIGV